MTQIQRFDNGEVHIIGGTVDDLIQELSAIPAEVRSRRLYAFDGGSAVNRVSIEPWSATAEDNEPAVVIDSA